MDVGEPRTLWSKLGLAQLLVLALSTLPAVSQASDSESPSSEALFLYADGSRNMEAFEALWKTVDERFFDPDFNGADWESLGDKYRTRAGAARTRAELSLVANEMLSHLKTSHTAHYTPADKFYYLIFDVFSRSPNLDKERFRLFEDGEVSFDGIGIFTVQIGGKFFVEDIAEGSPAATAGLKVGDEMVSVDGDPFHAIHAFRDKGGKRVSVAFRRHAGEPQRSLSIPVERLNPGKMFARAMEESLRVIEWGRTKIGYVHVWSGAGEVYQSILAQQVEAGPLREVDALIMDLRGKIGGGGVKLLDVLDPRGPRTSFKGWDFEQESPRSFRGRSVWIIDEGVRSGAEVLAYTVRTEGFGPMFGSTTAGAVVGGSPFLMPDDSLLYVAVGDVRLEGIRLEGVGVAPDVEVPYPIPYSAGRDPQFERALKEAVGLAKP